MHVTRHPVTVCYVCGETLSAASHTDKQPSPGDISVCLYCQTVYTFTTSLTLEPMLGLDALPPDELAGIRAVQRKAKRLARGLGLIP